MTSIKKRNRIWKESPEYRSWQKMKSRCYTKTDKAYNNYGGRGIKVCDRWLESFKNFLEDMGEKPSSGHSLDRYPNNNGDYEPSNCRWATAKEQANNTRKTRWIELEGASINMSELSNRLNVTKNTIYNRIKRGVSIVGGDKKNKLVLDLETGIFYDSAKEAALAKNIAPPYLRSQLSGNAKNKTSLIYA